MQCVVGLGRTKCAIVGNVATLFNVWPVTQDATPIEWHLNVH